VPELRLVKNKLGRGALNAVRTGIEAARGRYIVLVNGDLSDEADTINTMVEKAREGFDVVCGTRYSKGGQKLGGPFVQDLMSRAANFTFHALTRFPTRDATNSFKLYRADFLKQTPIESRGGFEFSFELAVKARARGRKVCEVPTIWRQRKSGESRFRLLSWLRQYVKWYSLGVLNAWFGKRV
jgi:glycosyltransferase involved in cell wall biosynthesis